MIKKKIAIICSKQITKHSDHYLAEKLKKKDKYYVISVLANISSSNLKFYKEKYNNYFDEIIVEPNEFNSIKKNIKKEILDEEIKYFEKKYKLSLNNLFFNHRVIGGGFFASGGINHPKTFLRENTNFTDIRKIALDRLKFWEKILNRRKIIIALNLPNEAHVMAKYKNIISERLMSARFGNTQFWTNDLYLQPDNLKKNFNRIKLPLKKVEINQPYKTSQVYKKTHLKNFSLLETFILSNVNFIKTLVGKFRGYKKSLNTYIFDQYIGYWNRRSQFKQNLKLGEVNSLNCKKYKYIFFPLLAEPEIALHGIARDYFFQLSALNLLSRDLPSDHYIIVKEHLLAIGRRPRDFYKQISALNNVLFADPLENGISYIKNARAVACLTGTAGWEASALGVPVVTFSKNNAFNFLNHVFYVSDTNKLSQILLKILSNSMPNKKSIEDGARFYHSYFKSSFDLVELDEFISWKDKGLSIQKSKAYAELLYKELYRKIKD